MTCPSCSRKLSWRDTRLQTAFSCPACHQRLRMPKFYTLITRVLEVGLSFSFWYVLGARDTLWILLGVVTLPIVAFVLAVIAPTICPPRLKVVPHEHLTDGLLHLNNGREQDR